MKILKFNRIFFKRFFGIIFIISLLRLILGLFLLFLSIHWARLLPPLEYKQFLGSTKVLIITKIAATASFFLPLVGGYLIGVKLKKKGILYGAFLGVCIILIPIIIFLFYGIFTFLFFSPREKVSLTYLNIVVYNSLFKQKLTTIITIITTAIGAYLGEKLHKKTRK